MPLKQSHARLLYPATFQTLHFYIWRHDVRYKNGGDEAVWLRDIRMGIPVYRASIEYSSLLSVPDPRHRSGLGSSV